MSTYAKYLPLTSEGSDDVISVNGQVGVVVLVPSDLGLGPSDTVTFGNIIDNGLTANRAVVTNSSKELVSSATTDTEIGFVNGVTSSIQTQLNGKQNTLTLGNLTDVGTDGITVTGGTGAVVGSGTSLSQHVADSSHNGYLSSTDWSTFNSKQPSGNYVVGPGSSTDTAITKFNGTSGVLVQNSNVTIASNGSISSLNSGANITLGASGALSKILTTSGSGSTAATDLTVQTGSAATGAGTGRAGSLTLQAGATSSSSAGAQPGNIQINAGNVTNASSTAQGGSVNIQSGSNVAGASAPGGIIQVTAGDGGNAGSGGSLFIQAGTAQGTGAGGSVSINAGTGANSGSGSGAGGSLSFNAGASGGSGQAGTVTILGGEAFTSGAGGDVTITSGGADSASGTPVGGQLALTSGYANSTSPAGDVTITGGQNFAAGRGGNVILASGSGGSNGIVQVGATSTTNKNALNNALATNASGSLTLTNAPAGKSGNPTGYLLITINGSDRVIPFW